MAQVRASRVPLAAELDSVLRDEGLSPQTRGEALVRSLRRFGVSAAFFAQFCQWLRLFSAI